MSGNRGYRSLIIGGTVSLALVGLVTVILARQELVKALSNIRWELIPLALVLTFISYTGLTINFRIVYRVFTSLIPDRDLYEIGFISVALSNTVFLGGIPEYLLRGLLMKPRGLSFSEILVPSILHSYVKDGIYFLGAPVAIAYILAQRLLSASQASGVIAGTSVEVAFIVAATLMVFYSPVRILALRFLGRAWKFFTRRDQSDFFMGMDATARAGFDKLRGSPVTVSSIFLFIFLDWAAAFSTLYVCQLTVGLTVEPQLIILAYVGARAAGMLSLTPGGAGVQEASMAAVLSLFGYPLSQALLGATLFRIIYYLVPFVFSLALYRRLVARAIRSL